MYYESHKFYFIEIVKSYLEKIKTSNIYLIILAFLNKKKLTEYHKLIYKK